jgi:DNA-binding GntR family transcriptional regulator
MQPVRDAVGRVVAASALEMGPGRSIRVPVLTRKQADEIWSMRLLLEGEAAARYAARKPGAEVRRLFEHTRTLRSLRYGIDLEATMRSLVDWNDDLRYGSDASILFDMISRIHLLSAPFIAQAFTMSVPHDENFVQFTIQIQDELILAIEQGDAEAARHLRCADLRSFQRYIYACNGWWRLKPCAQIASSRPRSIRRSWRPAAASAATASPFGSEDEIGMLNLIDAASRKVQ